MSSERKILKATRRKKEDYINTLPDEVLRIIFDHLDLESVKSASASCQRWHSIIFLSGYISRFVFKIELHSYSRNTSARQMKITELKAIATKSQRCYRNLRWEDAGRSADEYSTAWEAIHPKVTKHLHSLELIYASSSKMLPLIADALPLMSVLQSLALIGDRWYVGNQDIIPTLRSDNLKHLKIRSRVKYRLDMPHLQSFEGRLSAFYLPDDNLEAVAFSRLKNLSVNSNANEDTTQQRILMLRSLFRQARLETIRWKDTLENEVFSLICETCTTLKELHLQHDPSNLNDLNSLAKLTNLRMLGISYSSIDIDLSKINQLEELQLLDVENDVKLPTSIRKLRVRISNDNELNMSHIILSSCTHLTELVVEIEEEDDYLKCHAPLNIIEALPLLKQLKMLKFIRGRFRCYIFMCMDAPLDTLLQLHFVESNVSPKRLYGIQDFFPNLKKLSFSKCGHWKEIQDTESESTESDEDA